MDSMVWNNPLLTSQKILHVNPTLNRQIVTRKNEKRQIKAASHVREVRTTKLHTQPQHRIGVLKKLNLNPVNH